ncbi:MAG TPA: CDP-glycerol--glycerophosphate glycerophosphotransferase [Glutamicibacter sp.]|uniref:Transferase n=1 Tax=Glutamicibacter arilaitensis (strain DSM 16368 / CIP 108037 / IAM 15318 / JCM 13566 / NCIMB 14258 / Re117) TaxID=861360 RepID=A0ABP1U263_GLUAR|nr:MULTISPECIES: CDP-glycerol glycerophosphotransferase family protein [Glutamicibacter]CBT75543.1 putative transferase [Glutamicibacter arilaitensis Re117]HCH48567.1 CDP-glycerol--glycerophosphate glycerophosphotransferase [Glutamicibacter sp.]
MIGFLLELGTSLKSETRQLLSSLGRSIKIQETLGWIGIENGRTFNHEIENLPVPATVVVYFGDEPDKTYQLIQWLPVLEQLNQKHPVVLLFRRVESFRMMQRHTDLPRIFVRRFSSLMDLYEDNRYQLVIYVNNSRTNFQSLEHPRPVHVHVNHGESDKVSMVSNKAKAYDRVFVAGPAAIDRHRQRLIDFGLDKLLVTGRPQLDIEFDPLVEPSNRKTVMYAPTWQGENEDNNYTSMDLYGREIVQALLADPGNRVIYKPHPRILDTRDLEVKAAHEAICSLIAKANSVGADHEFFDSGNILAMFDSVDAMITDVSSVGLDFLYLCPEKPLILTDRRQNEDQLAIDAPISRSCPIINLVTKESLGSLLPVWIEDDEMARMRLESREFYFGNLKRGESTRKFFEQISSLIAERQDKISGYRAWHPTIESE